MKENNADRIGRFISSIMSKRKLSTYDIERLSGKKITQSYVGRIKNGKIENPSPDKLKALAKGLGITEEEIFSVMRGKSPNSGLIANEQIESLTLKFEKLSSSKKIYAQALIDLLNREFDRLIEEN